MAQTSIPSGQIRDAGVTLDDLAAAVIAKLLPVGCEVWFAGPIASIPTGWLFADGSAVSRTTYADLFAVLGTIHGVGDGSTTFNLPDRRNRSPAGAQEDVTGVPKTNITGTLVQTGGAATHTLTEAQMPGHTHPVSPSTVGGTLAAQGYGGGNSIYAVGAAITTGQTGASNSHPNVHPIFASVPIIKY